MIYKTKADGNRYKELRKKTGLTQKGVASLLNLEFSAISKWERGLAIPDQSNLPKIAELYNTTTDYLLTGKEPETQLIEVVPQETSYIQELYNELSDKAKDLLVSYAEGMIIGQRGELPQEILTKKLKATK